EYLLGREAWNRATEKGLTDALEHFNRSKEIDPDFAMAWVGVADYYAQAADTIVVPTEAIAKQTAAAQRALALDDSLGEAHLALASAKWNQYEWREAELGLQRALELKPNYALGH